MSKVVYIDDKANGIVARMNWSVYQGAKQRRSHILRAASGLDAKRFVLNDETGTSILGLETDDVTATEVSQKVKRRFSFALLCRNYLLTSEEDELASDNGIFFMEVDGEEGRIAICIVRNGGIHRDSVEALDKAIALAESQYEEMGGYCHVYSNSKSLPMATVKPIEWDDIADEAGKATQLNSMPLSPLVPIALLGLIAAIGLGIGYYQMVHVPKKEAERAKRMAEADKTALYLKALREAASSVGWTHESLTTTVNDLMSQSYFINGWKLREVTCEPQKCTEKWSREGGLLDDLLSAKPLSTMVSEGQIKADEVVLERQAPAQAASLDLNALPAGALEIQKSFLPIVQRLDNAGIRMQVGKTEPWPRFNGIRNVKKKDAIVKSVKLSVRVPYPFGVDAIKEMPSHIVIDKFTMMALNPKDFSLTLEGKGYVR